MADTPIALFPSTKAIIEKEAVNLYISRYLPDKNHKNERWQTLLRHSNNTPSSTPGTLLEHSSARSGRKKSLTAFPETPNTHAPADVCSSKALLLVGRRNV